MPTTCVALLRGINVGGNTIVPMAALRQHLTDTGLKSVKTYIQSGNVVFNASVANHEALAQLIGDAIEQHFACRPTVFVLSHTEIANALRANPFIDSGVADNRVHLFFLADDPAADAVEAASALATETEACALADGVFFLMAPDGIGRSKLAARVESVLGVTATARNLRTVRKLDALATQIDSPA
ncbi:MAG: DUF1697 domain-containing protein [Pseudomonadota bacterium]